MKVIYGTKNFLDIVPINKNCLALQQNMVLGLN